MNEFGFHKLLTMGFQTPKLEKSDNKDYGFKSAIQYLKPHKSSGLMNMCPQASVGCAAACLNTAGRGRYDNIQQARYNRTKLFVNDRTSYHRLLIREIEAFVKKCKKTKDVPAIRLNGTSDLKWEEMFPGLIDAYPEVQFYDYTKVEKRMMRYLNGELPVNYHLTFSRSESNDAACKRVLKRGGNVVVVFDKVPNEWNGHQVYDADSHDLRFLDPKGGVGGLKAKGKAKHDTTGFVVSV